MNPPTGLNLTHMSLSQKCMELSNLIRERLASNMSRSVLAQYRPIVEDIFGIMPVQEQSSFLQSIENKPNQINTSQPIPNYVIPEGWHLKLLTRQRSPGDYDAVLTFLHPDGIFFALIKSLMMETSAKFEFPISQFPPYFRSLFESGAAPPFFANKVISTSHDQANHLILNPFEFYIFHFSLYILNNSGATYDPSSVVSSEPAYFALLKIYLNYFVPIDSVPRTTDGLNDNGTNQQSSLWQSLSSKTTSILNLATSGNQTTGGVTTSPPSLFKASIFQAQAPFTRTVTTNFMSPAVSLNHGQSDHLGSVEWRCSTFFLILTELWYGNIPAPKTNYILRSSPIDDLSIPSLQPYSANIDQMAAVRIVIKHLHSFSNSFTYSPMSHINNQGLAEIKQSIWTSKYPLQRRLYNFMKVAFNRWPLDYTFRQPLEAWLSYIQPWRYVKMNASASNNLNNDLDDLDASSRGVTLIDVPSVDNHWRNFISDNLLYYTAIFFLLIDRVLKLDLSSSRNALILFRVIKVYSQPGFLVLLREAEEAVIRNNISHGFNKSSPKFSTPIRLTNDPANVSKAKLLAPSFLANGRVSTPKSRLGAFELHLSNLENDSSDFNYVSLFSPQAKQHMTKLLVEIQRSRIMIKEFVQHVETNSKLRTKGWLESIKSFLTMDDACFESEDEREMYKDKIQAEDYLAFATNKITQYFDVQMPEITMPDRNPNNLTSSQKIFFRF